MKSFHSLLFSLLVIVIASHSQNKNSQDLFGVPLVKHFESSDYQGGIQNWSFDQDSIGVLYVANNNGLLEFDGNKWKKYDVPGCTKVRAVHVDKKNRIFVGGQGQIGYFYHTNFGLKFESLLPYLPGNYQTVSEVWKIIEIQDKIFFNTESQLFLYDGESMKVLQIPGYINLAFNVGERIFVHFFGSGIYEFVDDEFVLTIDHYQLPDVKSLLNSGEDLILFGGDGSILVYRNSKLEKISLSFELGIINSVIQLSSNDFAVATQNKGLFILDSGFNLKYHLNKNRGLADRTVKAVYEDDFNNLWLALNVGIDYIKLSLPFSLINDELGVEGTGYNAAKFKSKYYLATSNGLFEYQGKISNEGSDYTLIPGTEGQIYNLSPIGEDLFINHHRGTFVLVNGQIKQNHFIGSWKLMESNIPDVLFGGDYQGISIFSKHNNQWLKTNAIPGLNESSRVLEYDNDTTLWMTHGNKGAYRLLFRKNTNDVYAIQHFGKSNGFPSDIMISVYKLNKNLFFTSEKGIFSFNYETEMFERSSFFDKWLGEAHVNELEGDGNQAIYYIQNMEMGKLLQESLGEYQKITGIFQHINKYINDDLSNISVLDQNNILIGAKEGFILYKPNQHLSSKHELKVFLRSVDITSFEDSTTSFYPKAIDKSEIQRNNAIKFNYSSPFYDGFEDITYSYRLLPLNKNWSSWTSKGEMEYPYLPSGNYTFEVKSKNIYGNQSPVTSFSFTILRPWYYSSWAIFIYVFLLLFAFIYVLYVQNKKHNAEKHILNKNKDQAIQSKNEEISFISEESKKEINKLQNEKLKTEINLKNDQLTTITMQLMQNNEYILDIKKRISQSLEKNADQKELKKIIQTIDSNLENNDSWDQFAYHFDQVHGGYLQKLSSKNIRLSPRELKLASFLRMNMSSKEISKLMNVTVRSVELARYRLRRKLKLGRDQNLVEYLIDLDVE